MKSGLKGEWNANAQQKLELWLAKPGKQLQLRDEPDADKASSKESSSTSSDSSSTEENEQDHNGNNENEPNNNSDDDVDDPTSDNNDNDLEDQTRDTDENKQVNEPRKKKLRLALDMASSRELGSLPGWRRSKQIDCFRERPGEVHVPVLLDDPNWATCEESGAHCAQQCMG